MAHPIPAQFPKTCPCCRAGFADGETWGLLPKVGEIVDPYCRLELRNCGCGSTLGAITEVFDPSQE